MNALRNVFNQSIAKHICYNAIRNYAFKSDLKIKWVRPGKVPCYKPEKSGDLEAMKPVPQTELQYDFQNSKELESADEIVKKLFTLEFAPRSQTTRLAIKDTITIVKRHENDFGSIESKIARWTGAIRSMQEIMERFPRNKGVKRRVKELIDKRRKHLKYLRRWDYKRFEWVLEKLNIIYKPTPHYTEWYKVTRKDSLRRLTNLHCDNIRNERLAAFRAMLEAEQPGFLEEKIRTLEFVRKEQEECGVPVTVEQQEIDEAKTRLDELLKQQQLAKEKEESDH